MLDSFSNPKKNDGMNDKCGVFGVYTKDLSHDVARIAYYGLYGLQHRGQESAGIAVSNGKRFKLRRGMGLVRDVFKTDRHFLHLGKGIIAVGHNRYSTTGSSYACNAQPFLLQEDGKQLVIAHNGNLINSLELKKKIRNLKLSSTTDTEIVGALLLESRKKTWEERFDEVLPTLKGAYSFVVSTPTLLFGIRDPYGVRPLILGEIENGWVLSSEDCIFSGIGAKFVREIEVGEAVVIDKDGPRTFYRQKVKGYAPCIFEYIYLARPDSTFNKLSIGKVREKCGEILAKEAPVKTDMVMPIPDSGTAAAVGYANQSNIPFGEGVIQNRYIGRTFIHPDQHLRNLGIKIKFGPMKENLRDKDVIVVDDSIVRGSTLRDFVKLLKNYGAKKVHIRIASPPITDPCFYGVDTPTKKELIAGSFKKNLKEEVEIIRKFIGADSLSYISLKGLLEAVKLKPQKNINPKNIPFCTACLTGTYKIELSGTEGKFQLEENNPKSEMKKIAILISNEGKGTNLQAIIDNIENKKIKGQIVVVVSDKKNAYGLTRAKKHNLKIEIVEKKEKLLKTLRKYDVEFICLTGWKQIVTEDVIKAFKDKIINTHPGFIPDKMNAVAKNPDGTKALWNKGKMTTKAIQNVLNNKSSFASCTSHFLTNELDFGPVLGRCFEKVQKKDTVESLYSRLKEKENKLYVTVLTRLCNE